MATGRPPPSIEEAAKEIKSILTSAAREGLSARDIEDDYNAINSVKMQTVLAANNLRSLDDLMNTPQVRSIADNRRGRWFPKHDPTNLVQSQVLRAKRGVTQTSLGNKQQAPKKPQTRSSRGTARSTSSRGRVAPASNFGRPAPAFVPAARGRSAPNRGGGRQIPPRMQNQQRGGGGAYNFRQPGPPLQQQHFNPPQQQQQPFNQQRQQPSQFPNWQAQEFQPRPAAVQPVQPLMPQAVPLISRSQPLMAPSQPGFSAQPQQQPQPQVRTAAPKSNIPAREHLTSMQFKVINKTTQNEPIVTQKQPESVARLMSDFQSIAHARPGTSSVQPPPTVQPIAAQLQPRLQPPQLQPRLQQPAPDQQPTLVRPVSAVPALRPVAAPVRDLPSFAPTPAPYTAAPTLTHPSLRPMLQPQQTLNLACIGDGPDVEMSDNEERPGEEDSEEELEDDDYPAWVNDPEPLVGFGSNGKPAEMNQELRKKINRVMYRKVPVHGMTIRQFQELFQKEYQHALRNKGDSNFNKLKQLFEAMPEIEVEQQTVTEKQRKLNPQAASEENTTFIRPMHRSTPPRRRARVPAAVCRKIWEILSEFKRPLPLTSLKRFYERQFESIYSWTEMGFRTEAEMLNSLNGHVLIVTERDNETLYAVKPLPQAYVAQQSAEYPAASGLPSQPQPSDFASSLDEQLYAHEQMASLVNGDEYEMRLLRHEVDEEGRFVDMDKDYIEQVYASAPDADESQNQRLVLVRPRFFQDPTCFTVMQEEFYPAYTVLHAEMQAYYANADNPAVCKAIVDADIRSGMPLALSDFWHGGGNWQRAEINDINLGDNLTDPDVSVTRVDIGDIAYYKASFLKNNARKIPKRFVDALPRLAVTCTMNNSCRLADDEGAQRRFSELTEQYKERELWGVVEDYNADDQIYTLTIVFTESDPETNETHELYLDDYLINEGVLVNGDEVFMEEMYQGIGALNVDGVIPPSPPASESPPIEVDLAQPRAESSSPVECGAAAQAHVVNGVGFDVSAGGDALQAYTAQELCEMRDAGQLPQERLAGLIETHRNEIYRAQQLLAAMGQNALLEHRVGILYENLKQLEAFSGRQA